MVFPERTLDPVRIARMAKASSGPLPPADPSAALPTVHLEIRAANGRATVYEVGDGGFLIGSVPGCDLRLPGANLAPVLCLISRHASGASLRKLAPVQPIMLNGRQVASTYLTHGDQVSLGVADLVVSISPAVGRPTPTAIPTAQAAPTGSEMTERLRQLQKIQEQVAGERAAWEQERANNELELGRQRRLIEDAAGNLRRIQQDLSTQQADLQSREQVWQAAQDELARQRLDVESRGEDLLKQEDDGASVRAELGQIRQQLYQRYHEKRDRLIKQHQGIRKAAQKLKDRKQRLDEQTAELDNLAQTWDLKKAELESGHEQLQRERQMLDDQHRLIASRQQEIQRDLAERLNELQSRETQLVEERAAFEKSQKQHQTDLVRLDRIQASLEVRQKQLQTQALEVDHRYEQLQRDSRDLEEQAAQLDDWHKRLTAEESQLEEKQKTQDEQTGQLDQRAAALESQQVMLATLRTRLERMREEARRQEETLTDQRVMQEAGEADLKTRLEEMRTLREALDNDRQLQAEERRRFEERRSTLDSAVSQLRQAQESLSVQEADLQAKQAQVDATATEQAEQAGILLARGNQLEELHQRLSGERQSLKDREGALAKAEVSVTALQEQLRRRSEELTERQRLLSEQDQRLQKQLTDWQAESRLAEKEQQLASERLETMRGELAARSTTLDLRQHELQEQEWKLREDRQRLEQGEQGLKGQRQVLASERVAWEVEQQSARDALANAESLLADARNEARTLAEQLPILETNASAVLERLLRSREQLREHLGEVHTYGRQSREDLELARKQVQVEFERVRQQELALHVARDEHRLSVAAFRQHLIEWQAQVGETKQTLQMDESRLDRKAAEVDQKVQQIESTSARLAQQAEELQQREMQVEVKRGEVDRHLVDMREWYRRKLRELSGVDIPDREMPEAPAEGHSEENAGPDQDESAEVERHILSINELDAGSRQLGDLLSSLELVDADTLTALQREARRQRRSLRQLLLAGNYLTLYQMALIEAGNLDGLVLGPVRIIDRLSATPHEAVYRVFDPRRETDAVLRVLAETEMHDAVHPDEYRQRFAALTAIDHVHLTATLEVLEIGDRPAVLQEWLTGLASCDWPPLAAAPGVWFRLVSQAALALQTAHGAGLIHGALEALSFVFTSEGVLKLQGLGEPRWLLAAPDDGEPSVADDLRRLGQVVAGWAALAPGKGSKPKALPQPLQTILQRLQNPEGKQTFTSAQELLAALEAAGSSVAANATAWERFVTEVREQSRSVAERRSA
jgi:hypothetical protein